MISLPSKNQICLPWFFVQVFRVFLSELFELGCTLFVSFCGEILTILIWADEWMSERWWDRIHWLSACSKLINNRSIQDQGISELWWRDYHSLRRLNYGKCFVLILLRHKSGIFIVCRIRLTLWWSAWKTRQMYLIKMLFKSRGWFSHITTFDIR